ncbi:GTP 3',8-cyclase MoaA [Altererythrobacter aquiaggeris]|uniref:GTP 3',8-cyclase MoaA n=1 Tax=Aestuarierythrobacter aquiaggeris TaxID=1898396 RepID=UPI003017DF10
MPAGAPLIDQFGRKITYLRLSVTDRCDLRCTYCMAESPQFLPRDELLTLEELERLSAIFIERGVRKIRITGGEPLVRRGVMRLFANLGRKLGGGLDELTLTTNATLLEKYAGELAAAGVKRVNVSLDSIDPQRFAAITRRGSLDAVLRGIDAAQAAGLAVKLNTVALKHGNADSIPDLVEWAHRRGIDVTLIEVMPLGETGEDRFDQYIPLSVIRESLEARFSLTDLAPADALGGPSRYARMLETGGRIGFITPLTNNFCAGCNRLRVTCTGRIFMCLGHEDHVDLRDIMRENPVDDGAVNAALDRALGAKPERHDFAIRTSGEKPAVPRTMAMTGG